ncbi:hypothetical protein C0J52_00839 [Blattella germanica]|nr:hypothetical protein C0J52_00839 [Blattella germanica]
MFVISQKHDMTIDRAENVSSCPKGYALQLRYCFELVTKRYILVFCTTRLTIQGQKTGTFMAPQVHYTRCSEQRLSQGDTIRVFLLTTRGGHFQRTTDDGTKNLK